MSWYKEYYNEWKEIIETVAREKGRTEQMVEKDTIQSMFLYELAKSELPFVFKGGTSLSKVYDLIDRFSEDIDLSMNRRPTQSERVKSKDLIINIAENLGLTLDNDRMESKNNPSAQLRYNIPEMLKDIISSRFYEADYRDITQKLLYEDVSYDYAVEHGIAVVAGTDLFEYKK